MQTMQNNAAGKSKAKEEDEDDGAYNLNMFYKPLIHLALEA